MISLVSMVLTSPYPPGVGATVEYLVVPLSHFLSKKKPKDNRVLKKYVDEKPAVKNLARLSLLVKCMLYTL